MLVDYQQGIECLTLTVLVPGFSYDECRPERAAKLKNIFSFHVSSDSSSEEA